MSSHPVDAVLQAGDTETLYRRAGAGPSVLILCNGALAEPLGGRLFERLAVRFRVVATALPDGDAGRELLATWLGDVLEGLGLVQPSLVLDATLADALLGDALAPEAFAGVVAVVGAGPQADATAVRASAALPGALIVPLDPGDVDAVAASAATAMKGFLAGELVPSRC